MKRRIEKLVESAWKARELGDLWQEKATDIEFIRGQSQLAEHNLRVAKCLHELNTRQPEGEGWEKCPDWVVTACYYSMHRAVLAFIANKGWKGKGHESTLGQLIEILDRAHLTRLAEEIGGKISEARNLRIAASYAVYSPEEFEKRIPALFKDVEWVLKTLEELEV